MLFFDHLRFDHFFGIRNDGVYRVPENQGPYVRLAAGHPNLLGQSRALELWPAQRLEMSRNTNHGVGGQII